ncbi:uncharacterized protein LOC128347180 isoform X2 [Hemicordylus capensis]|uniref:uncharacterized protein LOC128347180 isoform X2 n=1 Tax=Hemicordylus capensis TaxID=884348 RepID=UPI0023028822|nr:uncharacterized protein LOC128347180 isoform X2 [Hemicordylus capensis]
MWAQTTYCGRKKEECMGIVSFLLKWAYMVAVGSSPPLRRAPFPASPDRCPRHAALAGRSSLRTTMNTIIFNKLSNQMLFKESAKERDRSSSQPYGGVLDVSPHPEVLIPDSASIKDNLSLQHRRTGMLEAGHLKKNRH